MQVTRKSPRAPDSLSRVGRTAEAAYDPNGWNSRVVAPRAGCVSSALAPGCARGPSQQSFPSHGPPKWTGISSSPRASMAAVIRTLTLAALALAGALIAALPATAARPYVQVVSA